MTKGVAGPTDPVAPENPLRLSMTFFRFDDIVMATVWIRGVAVWEEVIFGGEGEDSVVGAVGTEDREKDVDDSWTGGYGASRRDFGERRCKSDSVAGLHGGRVIGWIVMMWGVKLVFCGR